MVQNVARSAPGAQPTIYDFFRRAMLAADILDFLASRSDRFPRATWRSTMVPGSSDLCMVVTLAESAPSSLETLDALRGSLLAAGFAVGTHAASPGALYLRPPFASPACEATS
jgi:hypothetical protein